MVNRIKAALLEGLFPNYCILCGLRSHRQVPLCEPCEAELQANTACCGCCAIPLAPADFSQSAAGKPRLCGHCLQSPPQFRQVLAPWIYCEGLAHIIQRWKFSGETRLTPLLASLWLQQVQALEPVDVLIPVPLHWRRLWRRGFNQSELLCRQLRALAPDVVAAQLDHRSVRRCRATPPQSGMGAGQRAINLRGAFTASGRYANLRVAIVDDVLTTGATANALAGVLRSAGARRVDLWCLARTPAPDT